MLPSTTKAEADGAKDTTLPLTVIAAAPGMSVWDPTKYWLAALGVIVEPAMVKGGRSNAGVDDTGCPFAEPEI